MPSFSDLSINKPNGGWLRNGLAWYKNTFFIEPPFLIFIALLLVGIIAIASKYEIAFKLQEEENNVLNSQDQGFRGQVADKKTFNDALLLSMDTYLPTHDDYLKELEKICPPYEPDGASYRNCLATLLVNNDKITESTYTSLVKDTHIIMDELKEEGHAEIIGWSNFLDALSAFHRAWKPYRDGLCNLGLADTWGGSGHEGFISICQLYQTELYTDRLLKLRNDWVDFEVERHIQSKIPAATEAFTRPNVFLSKKWGELLGRVYVPAKYSELCGFHAEEECSDFYFVNGELPAKLQNNLHGSPGNANITLSLGNAVTGALNLDDSTIVDIVVVPYLWCWASCGTGAYIVQEKGTAEVVAAIDLEKSNADSIEILDNKIRVLVNSPYYTQPSI